MDTSQIFWPTPNLADLWWNHHICESSIQHTSIQIPCPLSLLWCSHSVLLRYLNIHYCWYFQSKFPISELNLLCLHLANIIMALHLFCFFSTSSHAPSVFFLYASTLLSSHPIPSSLYSVESHFNHFHVLDFLCPQNIQ